MSQVAPRILLVDDDTEMSRLTAARLVTRGYSVVCAEGIGQDLIKDAVEKARCHYPHVIVLDWRLHGIYSEHSACEALMEALPPCGKVVLSRWATLDEANRVKDRFHAQVLHKSSPADRIIEVVQQVAADQCGFGWLFENQSFAVHWPESWPRPAVLSRILGEGTRVPEDLLDSLVWQLFNSLGDGRERNVSRVSLMELDGSVHSPHPPSLGHAVVVCASPSDRLQPVILKLAHAEPIER